MGITGEIVRNVFSKNRSVQSHAERKKWSSSVRSYLCRDEHSSVLAAEGSASFRSDRGTSFCTSNVGGGYISNTTTTSVICYAEDDIASLTSSEATVNQSLHIQADSTNESTNEKHNSTYKQEDAASIIQSAFRSFRETRRAQEDGSQVRDDKKEPTASPSRESVGTSIEVQTGNSSDIFSIKEESFDVSQTMRHRNKAQVLKIQEDWDDSTVSSVISKMRMQNRLEAATRRERALAYAFSQQLRICSKSKQIIAKGDETKTGWSWLERWMAARQPEVSLVSKKRSTLDDAMEEKESCGSNEICSLMLEVSKKRNVPRTTKTPTRPCPRESKMHISLTKQDVM